MAHLCAAALAIILSVCQIYTLCILFFVSMCILFRYILLRYTLVVICVDIHLTGVLVFRSLNTHSIRPSPRCSINDTNNPFWSIPGYTVDLSCCRHDLSKVCQKRYNHILDVCVCARTRARVGVS